MTKPRFATSLITLITVCLLALSCAASAQDNAADAVKLIDVLQLKPGSVVAEIGAGAGDLTIALATHVGATGRVYTNELGADRIQRLRAAVEKAGASNVQVVEGHESRANLDDGCCDAVFMRNVYHHFGDPPAMHASFLRALKPGGRIAIIDFRPGKGVAIAAPGKRGEDGSHGVSAEVVAEEMKAAGFEIISSEDRPLPRRPERNAADRWFIVVGAKPAR